MLDIRGPGGLAINKGLGSRLAGGYGGEIATGRFLNELLKQQIANHTASKTVEKRDLFPKSIAPEILSRYNISFKNKFRETMNPAALSARQTMTLMTQPTLDLLRHPMNPFAYLPGTWLVASALERLMLPAATVQALTPPDAPLAAPVSAPARKERAKPAQKRARKVGQEAAASGAALGAPTALDAPAGDVLVCQDDITINGAVVPTHPHAVMALSFYDAPRKAA